MRIGTVIPSYRPPPPPPPDPAPAVDVPYVEAKRKRPAMQPQSLLFDRAVGWTVGKAKEWAKSHGYKTGKVDVTDQYVRLRQLDPKGSTVKRTVTFGKGIRAVVAREETMPTKKKTTRRPAAKRTSAKRKHAAKLKVAPKRRTASRSKPRSKKASVVTARRRAHRVRAARPIATEAKRRRRRARETARPVVAEAKRRRKPAKRKSAARRKSTHRRKKGPASYVMAKHRRPRRSRKVSAWRGDSAGHSKAAKKGWRTRKGGKASKTTKKAAESRRRPRRHVRETLTVQARRRPKRRHAREATVVQARRRPKKRHHARETLSVKSRRRSYKGKRRVVRAPSIKSIARTAMHKGLEIGTAAAGYLVADALDRFLAGYDPSAATKPSNKFTSDGAGTLANALNVASAPDLWRYGSLGALTFLPLFGSLFIKKPAIRSSVEGAGLGAGIKLAATLWSNVLMPMLVGKDTSVPALQKSWVARLYPAEVSATLNMKSGSPTVSSAGKAGTLSDGPQAGVGKDAGPFALADRFGRHRDWVAPPAWPTPAAPDAPFGENPAFNAPPGGEAAPAPWPTHWGERHRWGLRGVGEAVEDMTHTIAVKTGVHPAHAVNAAMHAAAEPHDLTQALERALPHVNRTVLQETARHLHPHVVRMHAHARHPRMHGEWMDARAAEGVPAPEHDAPEQEWREWHGQRAAAGLPQAPLPPEPPALAPPTPEHLRARHEWHPKYDRRITSDRYATVQQVLGIGAGGPASSGNPGQPGLGEAFSDAVQTVAATVPNMPLENAVNATAYATAEPCDLVRAFERAMPQIRRALAQECASAVSPHIHAIIAQTGIPLPAAAPAVAPVVVETVPALPPTPAVIEYVPSPPPPSWTKSEAEWHEEDRRNWEHARAGSTHPAAVAAAATHAAEAAAAPHPDAKAPAVQAAVKAVADHAAQAASAAPPGTPAPEVHAAATHAAQAVAADSHPAVAEHPAVQAAVKAAATAATVTADHPVAVPPKTGTAGVGHPPRHLQVGPTKLPHPQGPQPLQSECGCLDDSPYLGFVGDEVEEDLMFNLN